MEEREDLCIVTEKDSSHSIPLLAKKLLCTLFKFSKKNLFKFILIPEISCPNITFLKSTSLFLSFLNLDWVNKFTLFLRFSKIQIIKNKSKYFLYIFWFSHFVKYSLNNF